VLEGEATGGFGRHSNLGDRIFFHVTRSLAVFVIILALLLVIALFQGSWEAIREFQFGFVTGTEWDPAVDQEFGALPLIVGTLVKAGLAILIAVPISIATAVFLALYTPRWLRTPLSYLVESLAAIPSVIIGLWGLFILVPIVRSLQIWLKDNFGWFPGFDGPAQFGVGVLAAGIILAIMITPIIASISRDLIRAVPESQMEGMLALGATRWEAIRKAVIPYARVGIIGAVILGLGRAVGETMAVTMVGGNAHRMLNSLFDPVHSMASIIAAEFTEATFDLYVSALFFVGLVLFAVTILIEIAAQALIWKISKGTGDARPMV
jgi:phosphate transport system permease protein